MSMIISTETTVTIDCKPIAAVFDQYKDILLQSNEESAVPCTLKVRGDTVRLTVSTVDQESCCPHSLKDVIYDLIVLCSGDEAIAAALHDGEDPDDLTEEFGEIISFVSVLSTRSDEWIDSIDSIRWETVTENCEDNTKTTELFTYDRTGGEKYSCKESKIKSQKRSKRIDYSLLYERLVCDFCDRECEEDEVVRKRSPDGSICTVCETCCQEYDLSDWETVGVE